MVSVMPQGLLIWHAEPSDWSVFDHTTLTLNNSTDTDGLLHINPSWIPRCSDQGATGNAKKSWESENVRRESPQPNSQCNQPHHHHFRIGSFMRLTGISTALHLPSRAIAPPGDQRPVRKSPWLLRSSQIRPETLLSWRQLNLETVTLSTRDIRLQRRFLSS